MYLLLRILFYTLMMSDSDEGKSRKFNTEIKYEAFDEENGMLFTGNFLIELIKGILKFLYQHDVSCQNSLT